MISISSVVSALGFYSAVLLLICLLRRWTRFLKRGGGYILLLASMLASLRLILPLEIPLTFVTRSWTILAVPQKFLRDNLELIQRLAILWAVGAVLVTAFQVLKLYLAYRECRGYTVVESEQVKEIAKRCGIDCTIKVSPDIEVPFVMGFFHCTIYLPYPELEDWATEMVLRHEVQHIRNHDVWIKLFFGLLATVMWWNLLVYPFRRVIDALLEFRCDAKVTKGMSEDEETRYMRALKHVADRVVSRKKVPALALNESFAVEAYMGPRRSKTVIEQRFAVLNAAREGKAPRWIRVVLSLVVVGLFFASYLVIFQPASVPPEEIFQNDVENYYYEKYDGPDFGGRTDDLFGAFILKGSDGRYQLYVDYEFSRYLSDDEVISEKYQDLFVFEEAIQK